MSTLHRIGILATMVLAVVLLFATMVVPMQTPQVEQISASCWRYSFGWGRISILCEDAGNGGFGYNPNDGWTYGGTGRSPSNYGPGYGGGGRF